MSVHECLFAYVHFLKGGKGEWYEVFNCILDLTKLLSTAEEEDTVTTCAFYIFAFFMFRVVGCAHISLTLFMYSTVFTIL